MKIKIALLVTCLLYTQEASAEAFPMNQKPTFSTRKPTRRIKRRSRNRPNNRRRISSEPVVDTTHRSQPIFSKTLSHFISLSNELDANVNSYIWEDIAPIPFDELIISWNAKRPEQGHITFWTSVQYGSQWSPWHRQASWGATKQRSFVNKLHQHVHTKHVRVELQRNQSACAFRVKAIFHDGATIDNLHAMFACCSYQSYFRPTRSHVNYPKLFESSNAIEIPLISQMLIDHHRYQDLCAPTSLSMVTSHFNQKFLSTYPNSTDEFYDYALKFAGKVHDYGIDIYGNWQLNAAQAYDACEGAVFFRVERLNSFDDLYSLLRHKVPVIVSVRRLKGGATPYANGHILVVVGWNPETKSVVCHDPAFKGKEITHEYPLRDFSRAWALSKNLSYVAIPKNIIDKLSDKIVS